MRRGLEISARSDDDKTIEDENGKRDTMSANAERQRLVEARDWQVPWRKWGPYLSERQWGTVREDYSEDGNAWDVTRHAVPRDRGATSRATLPGTPRPVVRSAMMDFGVRSGRSLEPRPCDTSTPADGVLSVPAWSSRESPRVRWTSGRWAVPQAGGEVKREL
jgi:hypothetical protein